MNREINAILQEALMCSVFVSPLDPGLTYQEAAAVCQSFGFLDGEIEDAAKQVLNNYINRNRYVPTIHAYTMMLHGMGEEPELINYDAIDFVYEELNQQVKMVGAANAKISRDVLVERAVAAGIDRIDVEGAITSYVFANALKLKDGQVSHAYSSGVMTLPGQNLRRSPRNNSAKRPHRTKVFSVVQDLVSRRSDGRPRHSEPLDAFSDTLEQIGFKPFRMWWTQTVSELRRTDPASAPVSCVVLSAALVEGALTFTAKHSRDKQLGAFQSSDFEGDPRTWKAEKLIDSAARGGPATILTAQLRARAEHLNRMRQRVHVGRLLGEHPGGVPDLRPEEGRDAKATTEQVVRAVLDWLDRASAT